MKKSVSLLTILFCFVFSLNATILIVDKNPTAPSGSYLNVADAVAAASPGDTIYITPAATDYGNFSLSKQLVIMGNGHYPNPYNDYPWISEVGNININHSNASGSTIMGLRIKKISTSISNVIDIIISQNRITENVNSSTGSTNWVIRKNLFYLSPSYYSNFKIFINNNAHWFIENNIFSGIRPTAGYVYFITNSNSHDVAISNNIFIGDSLVIGNYKVFSEVSNAIITNNIFYYKDPTGCEYCNFSNNLTYKTTQDTLPYGNNTGAYNISNQDPQFVNAPQTSHNYNYDYDYHLLQGSPGTNAGSDGTNIGIYGGTYPYSDIVQIPKVTNVHVLTPKIPLNDTLEVRVKAINY